MIYHPLVRILSFIYCLPLYIKTPRYTPVPYLDLLVFGNRYVHVLDHYHTILTSWSLGTAVCSWLQHAPSILDHCLSHYLLSLCSRLRCSFSHLRHFHPSCACASFLCLCIIPLIVHHISDCPALVVSWDYSTLPWLDSIHSVVTRQNIGGIWS